MTSAGTVEGRAYRTLQPVAKFLGADPRNREAVSLIQDVGDAALAASS
jgi:hypothetical protein